MAVSESIFPLYDWPACEQFSFTTLKPAFFNKGTKKCLYNIEIPNLIICFFVQKPKHRLFKNQRLEKIPTSFEKNERDHNMQHKHMTITQGHFLNRTFEIQIQSGRGCVLLTGLLRSAGRMLFPSTWSRNLRRASSSVGLCPAFPSFPRTRPLSRASK